MEPLTNHHQHLQREKYHSFFLSLVLTLVLGMISSPTKCQSLLHHYITVEGGVERVEGLPPNWYSLSVGKVTKARAAHLQVRLMGGTRYRQSTGGAWIRDAIGREAYQAYVVNDTTYFPFAIRSQTKFMALYLESELHPLRKNFYANQTRFSPYFSLGIGLHAADVRVNALDENGDRYPFTDSSRTIPFEEQVPRQFISINSNIDWDDSFEGRGKAYLDDGEPQMQVRMQLVTGLGLLYRLHSHWALNVDITTYWNLSILEWTNGNLVVPDNVSPLYNALQIGLRYEIKGWPNTYQRPLEDENR